MRIVDPTYGTAPRAVTEPAPGPRAIAPATTGLCGFSNSKPGAHDLIEGVLSRLRDRHPIGGTGFASKPNASVAARSEVLDHVAEQYRMAVVAIGD